MYILPTRACVTLALILVAMWYAAVSQSNAMAYMLLFFLASLAVCSMHYTHFNLSGLSAAPGRAEPCFAGTEAEVPVTLANPSRRERRSIEVSLEGGEGNWFVAAVPSGGGTAEARLRLRGEVRGEHPLPRLVLNSIYPLGLFQGRLLFRPPDDARVLVWPAPGGPLPLPRGDDLTRQESAADGIGGEDYAGSRAYRPGESQRHVDWRAVARGQGLLTKQFAGAGGRRVRLRWEDTAPLPGVEARLSQLCSWVVAAERGGFLYGLQIPGFGAAPARGESHRQACLRALALFPKAEAEVES